MNPVLSISASEESPEHEVIHNKFSTLFKKGGFFIFVIVCVLVMSSLNITILAKMFSSKRHNNYDGDIGDGDKSGYSDVHALGILARSTAKVRPVPESSTKWTTTPLRDSEQRVFHAPFDLFVTRYHYSRPPFHKYHTEHATLASTLAELYRRKRPTYRSYNRRPSVSCSDPTCTWFYNRLSHLFTRQTHPCDNFYKHTCIRNWFSPSFQHRTYAMESLKQLMTQLDTSLRDFVLQKGRLPQWIYNVAHVYDTCMRGNASRPMKELFLPAFLPRAPVVFMVGVQEMVARAERQTLNAAKIHPLADVFLAPSNHSGKMQFVAHIDSPDLVMRRFFLRYPEKTLKDYQLLVEEALSDLEDAAVIAKRMIRIETVLNDLTTHRTIVRFPDKNEVATASEDGGSGSGEFSNDTVRWLKSLIPTTSGAFSLRVRDRVYIRDVIKTLKKMCTPKDIAQYFNFRTLVHYAPFFNLTRLIPLGYGVEVPDVEPKIQACLNVAENLYKHGVRLLAHRAIRKSRASWKRHPIDRQVYELFNELRRTLRRYVQIWFEGATLLKAVEKLEAMKLKVLSDEGFPLERYASDTPPVNTVYDYPVLIKDALRREENFSENPDFSHHLSVFSVNAEYNTDTNTVYVPAGLLSLVSTLDESINPLLVPTLGGPIMRAMMVAIDVRGSTKLSYGKSSPWWSERDFELYQRRGRCFAGQYKTELERYRGNASSALPFFHHFVAENAIVEPLYEVFARRMKQMYQHGISGDIQLSQERLFFYSYALNACERSAIDNAQVTYKSAIPAEIRINKAFANTGWFHSAFNCPSGRPMTLSRRCSYW